MAKNKDLIFVDERPSIDVVLQNLNHTFRHNITGVIYYQGVPIQDLTKVQLQAVIYILMEVDR